MNTAFKKMVTYEQGGEGKGDRCSHVFFENKALKALKLHSDHLLIYCKSILNSLNYTYSILAYIYFLNCSCLGHNFCSVVVKTQK